MAYVSKYGKTYNTKTDYKMRQANFMATDAAIKAHNADPETTSESGHNAMSDYTASEWSNMKGYDSNISAPSKNFAEYSENSPHTDEIDWVSKGKVTPVQN